MTLPFRLEAVRRAELPSGATVLAVPWRRLPLLATVLMLKRGAEGDPPAKAGLADLTAEALTLGTKKRTAEDLYRKVEGLGASLSASSGWDHSVLRLRGLEEDAKELLSLLGEVCLEPGFAADEISKALQRRVAELTKSRDEPERIADELIWSEIMADSPYGHPSYGTLTSLRSLGIEDVKAFYAANYNPVDAVLLLLGDRGPEELFEEGAALMEGWSGSGEDLRPLSPSVEGRKILLVDRSDLSQSQIRMAFTGLDRRDPRYFAYRLMNYILGGGGFSSRLMERVRSQKGFTYGIRSSIHPLKVRGPLIISTFTPTETTLQAFEEVVATVEDFLREGPTERELEEAKGYYCGNFPLRLEPLGQLVKEILELELYGLGLEELEAFPQRIRAVSLEETLEVAKEVLTLEAFRAVIVGRVKDLEKAFARWGKVEVKSFADVAAQ